MQCTSHLKQLGLAVHNHHDTHNVMPGAGTGPRQNRTAFVVILPFFEETARYDAIQALATYTTCPNTTGNVCSAGRCIDPYRDHACWKGSINILRCPSDGGVRSGYTPSGDVTGPYVATNYSFSEADFVMRDYGESGNFRSPFGMARSVEWGGRWGNESMHGLGSITDGTSNTIVFSERCATPGNASQIEESIRKGVYGQGFDTWNRLPSVCMATRGSGGQYVPNGQPKGGSGSNFAYYTNNNGLFHTIIPPNGPSCSWTNGTSFGSYAAILAPTSFHTGGVNVCFADGSVRFVPETINYGDLTKWFRYTYSADQSPGPRASDEPTHPASGQSPYGIWGALGSMNGGESASL
jgi:prepilin-type processing-associated H-X9-DG protein